MGMNKLQLHKTKGNATLSVLITVVILIGCTAAGFLATIRRQKEVMKEQGRQQTFYIAESSASAAISQINGVNKKLAPVPSTGLGNIGSKENPESLAGGTCYTITLPNQGPKKNIWVVTSVADSKLYSGTLVATLRTSEPPFPGTAAALSGGDKGVGLNSNAFVDSYNTEMGNYTGIVGQNGDVGSNGDIILDSNAKVNGDANAAPGYTTTIRGSAIVTGSTTNLEEALSFDPILLPTNILFPNDFYYRETGTHTILSGNYKFTGFSITSNAIVTIKAPARLYITGNFLLNSNVILQIDNTSPGGVILYITGKFFMDSNTQLAHINNPKGWPEPGNFRIESTYKTNNFSLETDSAVNLKSNTSFYGTVYAPAGAVLLNSNADFFGAFSGRRVQIDSNSKVHYDEALQKKGNPNDPMAGYLSLIKWDWSLKAK